ncbi:MAG: tRNA-intron lyase [Haloarculaceae archaeon]
MHATLDGDLVRADSQARERLYDSRGYGRPVDAGDLALAPVEAAHLLYRGDLDGVDGQDFAAFLASAAVSEVAFFVYKDLRDRGFYPSPAREGWVDDPEGIDFVVHPRGDGPWDGTVAHRVRVVSEREGVPASALGDCVLAVVDEESEVTYLATEDSEPSGATEYDLPPVEGDLLADRVLCWEPPTELYGQAFYGKQLDDEDGAVQLSLVEAAYLARRDLLSVAGGAAALIERGREVEGERFERRLRVYATLRERGIVPKTGFKFGADFRTYAAVESADELGHSEHLVRVLPADHTFGPRNLALDVRLAHGVRKTMRFALVGESIRWLAVERLTP